MILPPPCTHLPRWVGSIILRTAVCFPAVHSTSSGEEFISCQEFVLGIPMVGNSNVLGIPILVVQWLGLGACTAKGLGSIPGQGTKISQVFKSINQSIDANVRACSLSHVRLFATPWTVAHQGPLSVESSRQEYWSGLQILVPKRCKYVCGMIFNIWQ